MKNVILAIALTCLAFETAMLYEVFAGKVQVAMPPRQDYLSELSK